MEKEEQMVRLKKYFECIKNTFDEFGPGEEFIAEARELLGFSHVISNVFCPVCNGTGYSVYGSTVTWTNGIGGMTITSGVCDCCWGVAGLIRSLAI